jgi:hypothetical protein
MAGCATTVIDTPHQEAAMTTHDVPITRQALIPGSPDAVFAFIVAEDVLPKVLTGYGPLPAVLGTSAHTGPWDTPGSARLIHLADGSSVREQISAFTPPRHFAYRVWDFGNPIIRTLATEAHGEWHFAPAPGGTLVTWTYTFSAKNAAAAVPLTAITQTLWRGYMNTCLDNAQRLMASAATDA